ncbi:MAG: choice-of-anchor A family protein, partial [Saprospiraceae bacterium]|nr:choice-of-anchor A family protein [Saprospiraceae bacterium]
MNKLFNTKIGGAIALLTFTFAFLGFVVNPGLKVDNSSSVITSFNPFGPAQGFGAFAFGDVDLIGSESEGPIAIGGDLIGFNNGYTVGPPVSPNPFPGSGTPIALLINGSVNWSGCSGELRITAEGHLKIGDCSGTTVTQSGNITTASGGGGSSIKVQGPVPQNSSTVCESNVLDFDAAYTQMNGYSIDMASCPATASLPNVNLGSGQNVINTTLSQINGINSVNMNGAIDQNNPLIINIDGQGATSGSWTVWNSTPQSSAIQYVIYHFYNIDNLEIEADNGLWGSVFAPNTNLEITGNNNIEGQIISNDLIDNGGEIHGHNNFASTVDGCGSGCTDPTVPTLTATPSTICNGSTSTITISGSLNDATEWHIYTGSCGGTQVGTTGSSTFTVSPTTTTTYYIRGEGGCVTPGACASIDVNVGNDPTADAGSNGTIDCENSSVTLDGSGSSTGSGITYLWTTNDGNIVSGETTLTPVVDAGGTYELTVTDGNCQNSASVTISSNPDDEDPTATCPSDITIDTDAGVCNAVVEFEIPAPDDNCGATSVASIASGSTFDLGTTTVTVTATDDAENTDTCEFTVTVEDNQDPKATCPSDITIDTDAGACNAVVDFDIPAPTDNCGATSVPNYNSGSTFDLGTTTVTVTATDGAENTDTCE